MRSTVASLLAFTGVCSVLLSPLFSSPAQAQFIDEDYLTGATLGPVGDDVTQEVTLSTPFTFFGSTYNSVFISTNGILGFTDNPDFYSDLFPNTTSGPVVAPLWSDWFTDADPAYASIYYRQDADKFLTTWLVRHVEDETILAEFQAALYDNGDIRFGYNLVDSRFAQYSADVNPLLGDAGLTGLNAGNGTDAVNGDMRGMPVQLTQRFYDYDPIATTYSLTVTSAPEPGTFLLFGSGIAAFAGVFVRRRK